MTHWKQIPTFPDYEITTAGTVRRTTDSTRARAGHIMKLTPTRDGYLNVGLSRNGKASARRVHRLVWETFRGPIPEGMVIDHLNGIRDDNRLENLDCVTYRENIIRGYSDPNRDPGYVATLTRDQVIEIREKRASGALLRDLAEAFDVTEACISLIVTGRTWKGVGGPIEKRRTRRQAVPLEERQAAVQAVQNGRHVNDVAADHGVRRETVYAWIRSS